MITNVRTWILGAAVLLGAAALGGAEARAQGFGFVGGPGFSVSFGNPYYGGYYGNPYYGGYGYGYPVVAPPVYVAPAPYVVRPAPVVIAPAPIFPYGRGYGGYYGYRRFGW